MEVETPIESHDTSEAVLFPWDALNETINRLPETSVVGSKRIGSALKGGTETIMTTVRRALRDNQESNTQEISDPILLDCFSRLRARVDTPASHPPPRPAIEIELEGPRDRALLTRVVERVNTFQRAVVRSTAEVGGTGSTKILLRETTHVRGTAAALKDAVGDGVKHAQATRLLNAKVAEMFNVIQPFWVATEDDCA